MSADREDLDMGGVGYEPGAEERAQLDALAEELRAACPQPPLSRSFLERLDARLAQPWTLRAAMDRNPVLRAAAGLLVLLMAGAPLAALIGLLPGWPGQRPELGFDVPALPPQVEEPAAEAKVPVVPPYDGDELFTPEWRRELERANRMALAGASWNDAGLGEAAAPTIEDWSRADAEALWQEFRHRCASGVSLPPSPALEARVRVLAEEGGDPRLGAWLWVLDGAPRADAQGWAGAPFLAR